MRVERVALPLLALLFITKLSLAVSAERNQRLLQASDDEDDTLRSNYNPSNGRNGMGIPFRPVRRIGSEFLGKRSEHPFPEDASMYELAEDKRALGSEFLGKRRLGSEFLGKRSNLDGDVIMWSPLNGDDEPAMNKRASLSQYVGRRRQTSPWEWYKRGLGSEFLGKRMLGSEFLGKRSPQQHQAWQQSL